MGKKILLADDSITIQKVIELTFSDEDFDVVTVGNGRLALEKLSEVRPDIVLCDIIMPEKDGYEVCEQIKKSSTFSHVPVLLLTGAFEPFDQERAARAGYDGSLAKPFEPETLIAKVRDLLARAPQRPAAPPVVPFARPTAVAPPQVAAPPPPPPLRAVAPPPPPPPPAEPAIFIPEEPFELPASPAAASSTSVAPLAPMSEEESATLLAAPEPEPESTSTVMFKAADLPWNAAPAPAPTTAAIPPVSVPPPPPVAHVEPAFVPEPESVFEPDALDTAEVVDEGAVFEEVVGEENLEFEAAGGTHVDEADSGATLMFPGTGTLPGAVAAQDASTTTASFGALEEATFSEADFEPAPASELEPEPEVATTPPTPASVFAPPPPPPRAPEPPRMTPPSLPAARPAEVPRMPTPPSLPSVRAAEVPRSVAPPSMAALRPKEPPLPPPAPAPPRLEPQSPQSFADLAPPEPERASAPVSEAAGVSVPVEMVEKIAQRVVAQISEKAVREIAWEVIPDLAEALIKQEIERLKAELQKT